MNIKPIFKESRNKLKKAQYHWGMKYLTFYCGNANTKIILVHFLLL